MDSECNPQKVEFLYIYILLIATLRQPRRTVTLFLLQKSKPACNEDDGERMVHCSHGAAGHDEKAKATCGEHRCIGRLAWHIGQADQTSLQTLSSMHWQVGLVYRSG